METLFTPQAGDRLGAAKRSRDYPNLRVSGGVSTDDVLQKMTSTTEPSDAEVVRGLSFLHRNECHSQTESPHVWYRPEIYWKIHSGDRSTN
jgi:hypothetical protein